MSETVTLAGYDWLAFFIVLSLTIIVVAWAWAIDHIGGYEQIMGSIATVIAFFGMMLAFSIFMNAAADHDHAQRVAAIHNLGYSDITVDGDKFTASDDGIYKSGAFVQVEGDQWIILEGK